MNLLIKKQKFEQKTAPIMVTVDNKKGKQGGDSADNVENAPLLPQILDITIVPNEKLNAYRNATIAYNRDGKQPAVAEIITIDDDALAQIIEFLAENRNYDMTEYKRTFEVLMSVGKNYLNAIENLREVYERKVDIKLEKMTLQELLTERQKIIPQEPTPTPTPAPEPEPEPTPTTEPIPEPTSEQTPEQVEENELAQQ